MTSESEIANRLRDEPKRWLVTGAAGFIGSHLVERLLGLGQDVRGLDDFSTGYRHNLDEVRSAVGASGNFEFTEGDIRNLDTCQKACRGVDYVLHQAALGSVPRSIKDPVNTNSVNVTGFLNMLTAARDCGAGRFVFAASSSTYGDSQKLPKTEEEIGSPLSPYAVTKYVNELYAAVFDDTYGLPTVGLRYFNVFGPRQDPDGAYAAVIPRWINALLQGERCAIYGDGETSRDFSYVANVVQANLLAAASELKPGSPRIFNVGCGDRTTLGELFELIRREVSRGDPSVASVRPDFEEFRTGDVRHSQADISRMREYLGYEPTHSVEAGIRATVEWFREKHLHRDATNSIRIAG